MLEGEFCCSGNVTDVASNRNVVVPLFCIPLVAPRNVNDVSCVVTK